RHSLLAENLRNGKNSDQNIGNCLFAATKDVIDGRSTRAATTVKYRLPLKSKKLARESVDVSSQLIDLIVNHSAGLGQEI
ncbi:MAG: hypothetical protein ABI137_05640, partial [Antricoccus sp.]